MPWTFYNANGQRLSSAATNIAVLDIDGATDIGAAIVDADLFIIDDGAGGTNRKTAASRIVTYVGADTDTRSGVAKAYCTVAADGTLQSNVYNVSGSTRQALGRYEVAWDTDFANTNYAVALTIVASGQDPGHSIDSPEVGTVDLDIVNSDESAYIDKAFHIIAFGDQ